MPSRIMKTSAASQQIAAVDEARTFLAAADARNSDALVTASRPCASRARRLSSPACCGGSITTGGGDYAGCGGYRGRAAEVLYRAHRAARGGEAGAR